MKKIIELIDNEVPIEVLLNYLKIKVDRSGFICCPFHGDNKPSLKVYGGHRGWYCYSCGLGGGSISFYKRFKGITVNRAVQSLAYIFKLKFNRGMLIDTKPKKIKYEVILMLAFYGWEKKLCKNVIDFIFSIEYLPLRKLFYNNWLNFGVDLIERTKRLLIYDRDINILKRTEIELAEFFIGLVDCWEENKFKVGSYERKYDFTKDFKSVLCDKTAKA
jgi:hypothetical protein